jgi:hypothetical protein
MLDARSVYRPGSRRFNVGGPDQHDVLAETTAWELAFEGVKATKLLCGQISEIILVAK